MTAIDPVVTILTPKCGHHCVFMRNDAGHPIEAHCNCPECHDTGTKTA